MRKTLSLIVICGFAFVALSKKHHNRDYESKGYGEEEVDTLESRSHFPRSHDRRGGGYLHGFPDEESPFTEEENPEFSDLGRRRHGNYKSLINYRFKRQWKNRPCILSSWQ